MTDRELLELAAKAAGIVLHWHEPTKSAWVDGPQTWNPLIDDGDALRLAVALGLVVNCSRPSAGEPDKPHAIWLDETASNAELTRRAIVLAAAKIGRSRP